MNNDFFNLVNFWQAIRIYGWWQVGIELLIIGLVVYSIMRFLRGTRGERMIKGTGFLLVVLYLIVRLIGSELHLERINFLYGKFLFFASFAAVVVFQPEIRRALMRLGETRFFRSFSVQLNEDIEALVESALFLSRRKIGALIAIEREVGLGGIAESGDLERELGSRHRAAVGMSQESDAVVLVVSEQSGDISIADRGQLLRRLSGDQLRTILSELLGGKQQPKKVMKAAAVL